jgi:hypothetical protein
MQNKEHKLLCEISIAKKSERYNLQSIILTELDQLVVLEIRMALELNHHWLDAAIL